MYHFSALHSETSGSSGYSNSSCSSVECSRGGIIAGSVLGFLFAGAALVLGIIHCHSRNKGTPWRSNQAFVHQASSKNLPPGEAQFNSGRWSSQYRQDGTLHGPHQCSLTFDDETAYVTGEGTDDIGQFIVDGTFSVNTHRMPLTKLYRVDTDNAPGLVWLTVTLQLTWDSDTARFKGKWYKIASRYRGEGKCELFSMANRY